MGMIVQHNMNALNAYNKLNTNVAGLKKSSEKLSSGYRINRAGDDAAGLAISEKMRSQIRGLNQAKRNAQDGISMIQTFEGAAQETHSILQRMKELATESANGTYDNATDRAAIQLEFDQLNDELNQIADTDFNGTVILNGGVMADGTRASGGTFNYNTSETDASIAAKATDYSTTGEHKIADNIKYNKTVADDIWNTLGLDVNKTQTVQVTFMYDGSNWAAKTATTTDGTVMSGVSVSGLTAKQIERDEATGEGGFSVNAGKSSLNVIFDEMKPGIKEGDTVTLKFTNSNDKNYAPKAAGWDEVETSAYSTDAAHWAGVTDKTTVVPGITVNKALTDDKMTDAIKTALDNLNNAKVKVTYADGVPTVAFDGTAPTDITLVDNSDGTWTATYKAGDAAEQKLVDISAKNFSTKEKVATAAQQTGTLAAGGAMKNVNITGGANVALPAAQGTNDAPIEKDAYDAEAATLNLTYVTAGNTDPAGNTVTATNDGWYTDDGTKFDGTVSAEDAGGNTITPANGDKVKYVAASVVNEPKGFDGDVTVGINVQAYNAANLSSVQAHAVATPKVATMAAQVGAVGASKADSFGNSTAIMTYTDNITLQTGARTKDSVNFSFQYNQDGTADMGELKPNLDLSSRANGLNTANLSLATQKDANYAIDQIDKAINKTSMVRATFGSIQNRLEHKIDNLTTTSENLTEAEAGIRDTDMAQEMMNYTKFNILQQAAQSMLAQANQQPQSILQLLG